MKNKRKRVFFAKGNTPTQTQTQVAKSSVQSLIHSSEIDYRVRANQVSDTTEKNTQSEIDRTKIYLFDGELCIIVNYNMQKIKSLPAGIDPIWKKKLTNEEINFFLERSINNAMEASACLLMKLRGTPWSKNEIDALIKSAISCGWYLGSPYEKELQAKILSRRMSRSLNTAEKILVYDMYKSKGLHNKAKEFVFENLITFGFVFAKKIFTDFIPEEKQIIEYSKQ